MSAKTITIIILTVLLTAFLMGNTDSVTFNFLWMQFDMSMLLAIGICVIIGFIVGFVVGRPRKTVSSYDDEIERHQSTPNKNELSDEDRDYIS